MQSQGKNSFRRQGLSSQRRIVFLRKIDMVTGYKTKMGYISFEGRSPLRCIQGPFTHVSLKNRLSPHIQGGKNEELLQ